MMKDAVVLQENFAPSDSCKMAKFHLGNSHTSTLKSASDFIYIMIDSGLFNAARRTAILTSVCSS